MNKYCVKGGKQLTKWIQEYNKNNLESCNIHGDSHEDYYYLCENHENFRYWNIEDFPPEGYIVLSFKEFKRIVLDGNQVQEQNFNIWN